MIKCVMDETITSSVQISSCSINLVIVSDEVYGDKISFFSLHNDPAMSKKNADVSRNLIV